MPLHQTNELLWYKLWPFKQYYLATVFLKSYRMVMKIFQIVKPELQNHVARALLGAKCITDL